MNLLLRRSHIWLSILGIFTLSNAISQSNTPCGGGGAPNLAVGATCSWTAGTTVGLTQQTNGWNFGTPSCGSIGPDGWYSFTAPASGSVTIDTQAGTTTDGCMALYSANPCNNTSWSELACDDDGGTGFMPTISQGALTPGQTYYIRVWDYGGGTGTFDICITENAPPPPCTGDIVVNSTTYSAAGLTTCGFGDDYSSTDACGSSYMNGDDIVIEWTPTTSECVSVNLTNTGTYTGVFITDGCPNDAGVSCLASNTSSTGNPSIGSYNVTAGQTYYITVSTWPTPQCTAFDIDIVACPPPPANDECTGAYTVPVNPIGSSCATTVSGTIAAATASYQSNSCGNTLDDDDVWFEFTATSTDVEINLNNVVGGTTDLYHSVWDVGCGGFGAATALVCSDPNTSTVGGLTIGNTYLVRVYSWSSTTTYNTTFDVCINELGPCGVSSATEDNCPYPAQLTQGPGSWSSSTYPYYTADTPANSGTIFCGSVENNSWYEFTAQNTTETFNFTAVNNCVTGWGVQAEVYEVTQDAQGCCTNFTSMSNCWNPSTPTTGTVTATGLTIGNTYVLMVDGWGGDNCDFTVSGWTATGIQLPVELVDFEGVALPRKNVLQWKTVFEENNDYFNVLRSFDGVNFETIDQIDGAGESQLTLNYVAVDYEVRTGPVYYKLEQVDFNGATKLSETIVLNRTPEGNGILAIYPNPTKSTLFIDINPNSNVGDEHVDLLDSRGTVLESLIITGKQFTQLQMNLENLSTGVYFIRYVDSEGVIYSDKVIKK